MNELLEKAIDKIRALPDDEQNAMAALMLERLSDKRQQHETFGRPWTAPFRHRPPEPLEISEGEDWEATPENAERISKHISALLEAGCVPEARRIVSKIQPGISEELDHWKKVLAEPVARLAGPGSGGDMRKDMVWIENNSDTYRGRWVALRNGVLLGSHESRAELHQIVKQSGMLAKSLFIRIRD